MAYVPVAAPVYASAEQLEQFASPQTMSRYADIPGLGRFAWYPLDTTACNGTTVIGTGAVISSGCHLTDTRVGRHALLKYGGGGRGRRRRGCGPSGRRT